jgi:predicted acylesterase/phospholipase RssA
MLFRNKLSEVEKAIANADDYQTFYQASLYHDELSGADQWKAEDESSEYDYQLIKKRVIRIKDALAKGDASGLMFILHEGIHGNLGNLATPKLSRHAKIGTKKLIEEFLDLVCDSLDVIYAADESEVGFYEKLSFFDETAHAYGQSCLMLSGGAGLGFFHAGVVKSLLEHDLIPNVVSGASAGSIIAGLVGTRTKDELKDILCAESIYHYFKGWSQFRGIHKEGFFDATNLENALIEVFDLMTFEEAFKKTDVKMTVTVSPADLHQISRLLNAKTSPNAIITQAIRASCAIPYVFSPVYLKAKNQFGEVIPFIPNRQFADGSLMADLPFGRLARLYGVNHSIVSQTNPLAAPFLAGSKNKTGSIKEMTFRHLANMAKKNSIYAFDVMEKMSPSDAVKRGIHKVRSIVEQQYVGNINILPKRKLNDFKQIFANPSIESLNGLISSAEKATWPQIDVIKRNTKISKHFRKYLKLLKVKESELLSYCSLKPDDKSDAKKASSSN